MTKDEILEGYLNIAYYGSGVYGIGTAANHYFSSPGVEADPGAGRAARRDGPEPDAGSTRPSTRRPRVVRRNVVLARMVQLGYITEAEQARAARSPLRLKVDVRPRAAARRPGSRRRSSATTCAATSRTARRAPPWARPVRSGRTGCSPVA